MTKDEFLTNEAEWLDKYNDAYREAMQNMSDPTYVRRLLRGIEQRLSNLLAYNPVESAPHVAVFIVAEVQAKMEKTLTDLAFVDQYEERRNSFEELRTSTAESLDDGNQFGPPESIGEL